MTKSSREPFTPLPTAAQILDGTPVLDGPQLFGNPTPSPVRQTSRRTPRPRPSSARILEVGDVLAAGLNNGRCPIGRVKAVDDHGFRLNLYSVSAGTFTVGAAVILWSQVSEFQLAVQGNGEPREMAPLAAFQAVWTRDAMP